MFSEQGFNGSLHFLLKGYLETTLFKTSENYQQYLAFFIEICNRNSVRVHAAHSLKVHNLTIYAVYLD